MISPILARFFKAVQDRRDAGENVRYFGLHPLSYQRLYEEAAEQIGFQGPMPSEFQVGGIEVFSDPNGVRLRLLSGS